jgi:hypothetical protein
MKMNRYTAFLAVTLTICLPLLGCKKSETTQTQSEKAAAERVAIPSGPVELKLKWTVGSRIEQRMDVVQNSEIFIPRMPKPMKQEMTMGQEFALSVLKERPGGGYELELEFLGNQMMVMMGERTVVNFDSQGESTDDNNPLAATFRKMVGARIKYLLDASNKVEKVEGLHDFRKRITTGAPNEAVAIFNSTFTEDYFKQMVNYAQNLPPKAVSIGDSWPVQIEMVLGPLGTMVVDLKYTFKGWDKREKRNCALLEYAGTINTKPGRGAGPLGMSISIEDGKSAGKSWFDPAAGLFVDSAIKQSMRMLMIMPDMAGGKTNATPRTQTVTNLMTQTIAMKVVENSGRTK